MSPNPQSPTQEKEKERKRKEKASELGKERDGCSRSRAAERGGVPVVGIPKRRLFRKVGADRRRHLWVSSTNTWFSPYLSLLVFLLLVLPLCLDRIFFPTNVFSVQFLAPIEFVVARFFLTSRFFFNGVLVFNWCFRSKKSE